MEEQKQYHSIAYHHYFENYAEKEVIDEDGRIHIERCYVGEYYAAKLSKKQLFCCKLLYCLLYLVAAAATLWVGSSVSAVGGFWYVTLPVAVSGIGLILAALPIFRYAAAPVEMEIRSYKETVLLLKPVGLGIGFALLFSAAVRTVAVIGNGVWSDLGEWCCCLLCILGSLAGFAIYFIQKNIKFEVLPPKKTRPVMSSPIGRHIY